MEKENILVKRLPELSERMAAVASMVSFGTAAADIGCDHGYVSIYLYNSGKCRKCIAADVKEGPLRTAEKNIEAYKAEEGVEVRLSDGLENISCGEADCLIISGMGGNLIIKILDAFPDKRDAAAEMVLEPQSDAEKVRRYLCSKGYSIEKEALVTERGKYYPVMKAVRSEKRQSLSEEEYIYGPCLIKNRDPLLKEYLHKEGRRIESVILELEAAGSKTAGERLYRLKKDAEMIEKVWNYMRE